jgi:alpha-tubulin suppressor-like RCC1 family protein
MLGALGSNTTYNRSSFVSITELADIVSIGAARYNSAAIKSDGTLWTTGTGTSGVLGNNATDPQSTFGPVIGVSAVMAVAIGDDRSMLALTASGDVYGTGTNSFGRLGDDSITDRSTFVKAVGISNAVAVSTSKMHSLALRADGLVFGTGYNTNGALAKGTTTTHRTFLQCTGVSNAIAIAAGADASFAIRADGLVFASGSGYLGQLGTGDTVNRLTFVQALGISSAIAIDSRMYQTAVLTADGRVFTCGSNGGESSNLDRSTFVQAIGISQAVAVACGYANTFALRSDGVLLSRGADAYGQLGSGTTLDRTTFAAVLPFWT